MVAPGLVRAASRSRTCVPGALATGHVVGDQQLGCPAPLVADEQRDQLVAPPSRLQAGRRRHRPGHDRGPGGGSWLGHGRGWRLRARLRPAFPPGPKGKARPQQPTATVRIRVTSSQARRLRRGVGNVASSWGFPVGVGDAMADAGSGWSGSNSDTGGRGVRQDASTAARSTSAVISGSASLWARAARSRRNASTSDCRQSCCLGVDAPACSSSTAGHSPSRWVRAAARVPPVVPPSKRSATRPCRSTSTTTGW